MAPRYRVDVRRLSVEGILHGIDLCFESGELVALLGPSGCGKSTLLRAMTAIAPGAGEVRICGRDLYREVDGLKRLIGFVPQDDVVHRALSVEKTLTYSARLRLESADQQAADRAVLRALAAVGLSDRRKVKVKNLSGGQRKRVSIAVELLAEPPLMFLDEPTSGLDPALEEQMMDLFRALTTEDRLTLVTTHITASLDRADLAVVMTKGRVVYVGPPRDAPAFFGATDAAEMYRVLAKDGAERWVTRFLASPLHRTYVVERLSRPPPPLPGQRAGSV